MDSNRNKYKTILKLQETTACPWSHAQQKKRNFRMKNSLEEKKISTQRIYKEPPRYIIRERKTRTGLTPHSHLEPSSTLQTCSDYFRPRKATTVDRNFPSELPSSYSSIRDYNCWENRVAWLEKIIIGRPPVVHWLSPLPRAGKHAKIVVGFRLDLDNRGMGIVCFTVLIAEI